jgi:hypothetical protein
VRRALQGVGAAAAVRALVRVLDEMSEETRQQAAGSAWLHGLKVVPSSVQRVQRQAPEEGLFFYRGPPWLPPPSTMPIYRRGHLDGMRKVRSTSRKLLYNF